MNEDSAINVDKNTDLSKIRTVDTIKFSCEKCGKQVFIIFKTFKKQRRFLCKECKRERSCIEKYGSKSMFHSAFLKEKRKEKYGVWIPREILDKIRKTKLEKYGDEFFTNYAKFKETIKERYGIKSLMESEKFKEKAKSTCLEKYGAECTLCSETSVRKRIKDTIKNRYGVENYFQTEEFKEKAKSACLQKFGVEHPLHNHEIFCKARKKYEFDGKTFDSKPEIEWYQKLKEYFTDFEYQPSIAFEYEFDGKTHKYFPDFKVGNVIYELKGAHFFKDGKMVNPFDRTQDRLYEAKHKCMIQNGVKIITL